MNKFIFVFGSNLKGIHGAGAARVALDQYGAVMGQGRGLVGQSYALPTKMSPSQGMTLPEVTFYIEEFLKFAEEHPEMSFKVTQIGCGLAGFAAHKIAPLFIGGQDNIYYDEAWVNYLEPSKYWGTY